MGETRVFVKGVALPKTYQVFVPKPVAVRLILLPEQRVASSIAITVGGTSTKISISLVFEQPFDAVPVTEYEVLEVGFTIMDAPV